jgi:hypothetical protein
VGGVALLKIAPGVLGVPSHLLPKLVHHPKFSVSKAISTSGMILYYSSEVATREKANSKEGEMVLVGLASRPPIRALAIKALLVKEAS